ncbi:MAG: hypothetical protein U9M90_02200 [Patescibacteria group bacterium]|nr:hypothetical protein [Patescibacteria group bacterium]
MFGFKKKKEQETKAEVLEFKVETMKDALQISKKSTKNKVRFGKRKFFSFFGKEKQTDRQTEKTRIVKKPSNRSISPFFTGKTSSVIKPKLSLQPEQQSIIKPEPKIEPPIPHEEKVEKKIEKIPLAAKPEPQISIAQKSVSQHKIERKPELAQDKKVSTKIEKYKTVEKKEEKFLKEEAFRKIIGKPLQQQKHYLKQKKPAFKYKTKKQDTILQKKDASGSFAEKKLKKHELPRQTKAVPSYISKYPIKHKLASPEKAVIEKKKGALKISQKKDTARYLKRQKEDWTKIFGVITDIPEELKQEPALPNLFGSKKPVGSPEPKTESRLQHKDKEKMEGKAIGTHLPPKLKPRIPVTPKPVPWHKPVPAQGENKYQTQQSRKPPTQFISRQGPFTKLYTQTKQYKPPEQFLKDQAPAGLKQKHTEPSHVKPKFVKPSPAKSEKLIEPDHAKPKFVERKPARQISQALKQMPEMSPKTQIAQKQEKAKQFGVEQAAIDEILQKLKSTKQQEVVPVPVQKAHSQLIREKLRHKAVEDTLKRIKDFEKTIKRSKPVAKTKPAGHVLNLKEEKEKPKALVNKAVKQEKTFPEKPFGEDKYPARNAPELHEYDKKQRVSEILSTKLAKYRTSLRKRKKRKIQAQLNIGNIDEIVTQPQGRLNKPLLIIAVILLFLTGGSGYFYYKYVLKNKPFEEIPFISDINISDKLDNLSSERQKSEKQIAILNEANSQQFSKNKMPASIKTYILSIKKTPEKAVELRNGFFVRPCDENNNRMTAVDILNSLNIELQEVHPYLDDDVFFFIIHNKKKTLDDPIIVKINLLLKIKNDSMEDEIAKIIESVETVLPTEFQVLYFDEKKPIVPRSIVFKSVPSKSEIVSRIHYFNYVAGDTTKSIEWSILTVNNSKYLTITTSKHATDSMILEFE